MKKRITVISVRRDFDMSDEEFYSKTVKVFTEHGLKKQLKYPLPNSSELEAADSIIYRFSVFDSCMVMGCLQKHTGASSTTQFASLRGETLAVSVHLARKTGRSARRFCTIAQYGLDTAIRPAHRAHGLFMARDPISRGNREDRRDCGNRRSAHSRLWLVAVRRAFGAARRAGRDGAAAALRRVVRGRPGQRLRFDANAWDATLAPADAASRAGRPAGFVLHPQE
jgi:hypothetical protein